MPPTAAAVYGVRVHWRGREAAESAVAAVHAELHGAPFEELSYALRQLDGTERFLIDFWWRTPLPPDDDDDDFHGDEWS